MHQRQDHAWQGLSPQCHMRCAVRLLFVLVLLGGVLLHGGGAAQPTRFEIGLVSLDYLVSHSFVFFVRKVSRRSV